MTEGCRGDCVSNFGRKRRADALIGIDLQNPVASAHLDTKIPPFALNLPGALRDPGIVSERNILRAVGAPIQHNDKVIRKGERVEAIIEISLFIMCHHKRGKPGRVCALVHAASALVRRQRSLAAFTTSSTARLSMSVSVLSGS